MKPLEFIACFFGGWIASAIGKSVAKSLPQYNKWLVWSLVVVPAIVIIFTIAVLLKRL